jgi:hypothetical protein
MKQLLFGTIRDSSTLGNDTVQYECFDE